MDIREFMLESFREIDPWEGIDQEWSEEERDWLEAGFLEDLEVYLEQLTIEGETDKARRVREVFFPRKIQ